MIYRGSAQIFAQEAHLRAIVETLPDATIVMDERGCILSFSAAAERLFGYREAELTGENISRLMPCPDGAQQDRYLASHLPTGVRKVLRSDQATTARRRDGTFFPIHLHIGEAWIGEERVFTGFIRDLTEAHRAEARLHALQAELASVSRVTAMGTLATSIAHELTQPLTAIANYVETARDLLENSDEATLGAVREALDQCADQSIRAGQIIRRMRDLVACGEAECRVESLSRIVGEASTLALVGAGEGGVEVQVRLDPLADKVLVDRIQLQQVLYNLIRNAIEAMADSPVRCLRISSSGGTGEHVRVTIADNGPGLIEEISEHLFQPFLSTKAEGMGLGLSICHAIILGHGGTIWAEPSAWGGAAFHFTIVGASAKPDA